MEMTLTKEQRVDFLKKVREDVSRYGIQEASIKDLLALIIGKNDFIAAAQLDAIPVRTLMNMRQEDFMEIDGIGKRTAEILTASIGLSKKLTNRSLPEMFVIRSPEDVYDCFKDLRHNEQEHFAVAFLDTKNQVIAKKTIFIGTLNASIVHPREIFKEALKMSACSIICAHSHPSGNPLPSPEDIQITKRLEKAGDVIDISLLDHVIIGDGDYVSLKEKGYIG